MSVPLTTLRGKPGSYGLAASRLAVGSVALVTLPRVRFGERLISYYLKVAPVPPNTTLPGTAAPSMLWKICQELPLICLTFDTHEDPTLGVVLL